ncbi:peptidase inhibitor family I36 protein [Streptomyces sp. NPDC001970]
MNIRRTITALGLGAALALGATTPATAGTGPTTPAAENTGVADKADRARDAEARQDAVIATYKGRKIDLTKGWGTAQVCSEYPDLTVKCFDNDAQAQADMAAYAKKDSRVLPRAPKGRSAMLAPKSPAAKAPDARGTRAAAAVTSCAYGWVCVYQDANWKGRKLQWSEGGTKSLGQYDFRDKTSSTCNNDEIGGMGLIDYRNNLPDPEIITPLGGCKSNLANDDYPGIGTGSWNDRADALWM